MAVQIDTPIQYLKGVGPKLGDILRRRGVSTVGELLEWFPRAYEDRRAARSISSLEEGQIVSLTAHVLSVRSINMGRSHRKIYDIVIADSTGRIGCKYFRVPYKGYFERFTANQKVRVSGKVTRYRGKIEFHHPDLELISEESDLAAEDRLIPLYTETEGISPAKIRKLVAHAFLELSTSAEGIPEVFPKNFRDKYQLLSRTQALREIHQPDPERVEEYLRFRSPAHRRLIFEEFFWMELHLAGKRMNYRNESAPAFKKDLSLVEKIKKNLPFKLTAAQERVFSEVAKDLSQPHPMHRLVQGDVGSGKTLVALMAAALAKSSGYQTALMAPTEILAEQHYKNASKYFEGTGIKIVLITGRLKTKEYAEATELVKSGNVDLIIGTHALIEESVDFSNLGLVIVDEQHRFGVEQRTKLKKGGSPHFLVMTATPIPRTLAMTVYGDLEVSVVDELPPGRSPIVTKKAFSSKREKVFGFMREQVEKGRQAYIIYPLVEESEKIDLKDAVSAFEEFQAKYPSIRFGLLHGKMKPNEKEEIMTKFYKGEIQVLVSTTVVEVGVDVPNANMIIIEHTERFGLSQLHQLRGRVGRGLHKSYCILMLGYALSEDAVARAEIIEGTTDGFKIAEADLEIRGPGEFLGQRQSGMPGFRLANLVRDLDLLKLAREAATDLLREDPSLKRPEYGLLRQKTQSLEVIG